MDNFEISIGVSKFRTSGLLNANFDRMEIDGGIGKCTLDFTGQTDERSEVFIDIGIASTVIILPRNVGVKVYADISAFTSFHIEEMIDIDDMEYVSENWGETDGELVIELEASIGFVEIVFED